MITRQAAVVAVIDQFEAIARRTFPASPGAFAPREGGDHEQAFVQAAASC